MSLAAGDRFETGTFSSGTPRREFLHVDDCADALVFLLQHYSEELYINVGSGEELTILELAQLVCEVVGFTGEIVHDRSNRWFLAHLDEARLSA